MSFHHNTRTGPDSDSFYGIDRSVAKPLGVGNPPKFTPAIGSVVGGQVQTGHVRVIFNAFKVR